MATEAAAGIIGKKVLRDTVGGHSRNEDPYYETVEGTNIFGQSTMKKRRKKAPDGLSDNDMKVFNHVKRRAYHLDQSLCHCCGVTFGWSSVIALVPFVGDTIDMFMAAEVVRKCNNIDGGLSTSLFVRMLVNVLFDFVIGFIPIVGDLGDAIYKCNTRNSVLLEDYLRRRAKANLKARRTHDLAPAGNITMEPRSELINVPQSAHVQDTGVIGSSKQTDYGRDGRMEPDLEMGRLS